MFGVLLSLNHRRSIDCLSDDNSAPGAERQAVLQQKLRDLNAEPFIQLAVVNFIVTTPPPPIHS